MSYMDNVDIPVECRRCGTKSLHKSGVLRRSPRATCPGCGHVTEFSADEMEKKVAMIRKMMEEYEE